MALRATVLADSPYAFWPMGQASAWNDLSGNGRPLSAGSGGPTQVASIVPGDTDADAGALHSTGAEYLTMPIPGSPTNFSLERWVKTSGACTIWGTYPIAYGGIDGSGNMFLDVIGVGTVTGTATLSDGNLHHLVWTFSSGVATLYADGVSLATGTAPSSLSGSSLFGYGSTPWLNGTLQDVAVYSTTLSAGQITTHYSSGTSGGGTNLTRSASDGLSEVTDSSGRLMALVRGFGDLLSAIADYAVNFGANVSLMRTAADTTPAITDAATGTVTTGVALVRTAHDTIPIISDTARRVVIESLQAQFHPEVVFKVFDLYTKEYFGMLPLDAVTFQCRYNTQVGTLQGTLSLDPAPNTPVRPEAIRLRRMLVVEVNEWPLWAGLIDALNWDSDSSIYQVRASELWSFYDAWPLTEDGVYTEQEEISIFADLIHRIELQTGGNIGLTKSFVPSSPAIIRNEAITGSANTLLGNFVRAHGTGIYQGYQVRGPRVLYDDPLIQTPRLLMEVAHPTLGNRYSGVNTPRFRYLPQGGEITKVTFEDNGATAAGYATTVVGTSILTGNPAPAPLTAISVNTALLSAGWPQQIYVLLPVANYPQDVLQARCDAELFRRALVYGAPSVTITLAALWQSQLLPGDDAVLVFHDNLRWPVKQTFVYRVVGIDVDVEAETATLTFDPSSVAILTAYGPELLDEALTQMPGTTNQNPSNGPGIDTGGPYYPPITIGPPNLPIGYPPPPTTPPPYVALLYRANQDSLAGSTVSFTSPTYGGSGPHLVASLPGAAQTDGQSIWFNTDWSGSIMGADEPVTLDLVWTSFTLGVVARTRVAVQARSDGPTEFSLALSYMAWSYNPLVASMVPSLEVTTASGAWTITHLDAEFQISTLAI
jgi:hypothetical protein